MSEKFESTSLDHTESDSSESESECKPSVEAYMNSKVLGQHAGELLLDLYSLKRNYEDMSSLTMPGMIVNKTEVRNYFLDNCLEKET